MRVADALAGLHARGVLHRDVKPANILIDGFGRPRLADSGCRVVTAPTCRPPMRCGSLPPMRHRRRSDAAATETGDVFSLAATVYALLSGHPPRRPATAGDQPSWSRSPLRRSRRCRG